MGSLLNLIKLLKGNKVNYKLLKPCTEEVWNNLKESLINLGNEDFIVGSSNYKDHQDYNNLSDGNLSLSKDELILNSISDNSSN